MEWLQRAAETQECQTRVMEGRGRRVAHLKPILLICKDSRKYWWLGCKLECACWSLLVSFLSATVSSVLPPQIQWWRRRCILSAFTSQNTPSFYRHNRIKYSSKYASPTWVFIRSFVMQMFSKPWPNLHPGSQYPYCPYRWANWIQEMEDFDPGHMISSCLNWL